jgi:hypothetical protein
VQIAQRGYSIKKIGTYKKREKKQRGIRGNTRSCQNEQASLVYDLGLATNTEGKSIQKVRKTSK